MGTSDAKRSLNDYERDALKIEMIDEHHGQLLTSPSNLKKSNRCSGPTRKIILSGILILSVVFGSVVIWSFHHQKAQEKGLEDPILQLRSYSKDNPDGIGHTFIFLRRDPSNNRRVAHRLRFPVARYDDQKSPKAGRFFQYFQRIRMYVDRRNKQTFIYGRSGSLYVLPPLESRSGRLFSVASLIDSGHASFKQLGSSRYDSSDVSDFYISKPIYGPEIPSYSSRYQRFVGSIYVDEEYNDYSEYYESPNNYYKTTKATSTAPSTTMGGVCKTGQEQSPIFVELPKTVYTPFTPFSLSAGYKEAINLKIDVQKGKTMTFTAKINDPSKLTVSGGCLDGEFHFHSGHIHWSRSEHIIQNTYFVAEAHFIHQNPITKQFAVFGFFFELIELNPDNVESETPKSWIQLLNKFNDRTEYMKDGLFSLMQGNFENFVCYNGSLTTPPCSEGLRWVLISSSIPINQRFIDNLKNNIGEKFYREPQKLNDRIVERSFPGEIWFEST